jgi:DNA-binding NarL/FixJ family response regulator
VRRRRPAGRLVTAGVVLATAVDSRRRACTTPCWSMRPMSRAGKLCAAADLAQAAFDAVLVLTAVADEALEHELLAAGVQAIVPADDAAAMWRAMRHAVARKQALSGACTRLRHRSGHRPAAPGTVGGAHDPAAGAART